MPKYEPLADFLNSLPKAQKQVTLGFKRLEDLLGEPLPPSASEVRPTRRESGVRV